MENIFNINKGDGLSALELFDASTPEFFRPSITMDDLPAIQANEQASFELENQRDNLGLTLAPSNIQGDIPLNINPDDGIGNFFAPTTRSPIEDTLASPTFNNNTNGGGGSVVAQVTRYGFEGDKYQSKRATSKGSKYENIGNRNNKLRRGVSVALPPMTAKALGINSKAGDIVEANIGGKWQQFSVDDTTANHKNHRIDFFDPEGKRVKLDGSNIEIRKAR